MSSKQESLFTMLVQSLVPLILLSTFGIAESADPKPNIVFILTDDQGYGDLGCFGFRNIATPKIDRLFEAGMKFTSLYVTNRCSPTRLAFIRENKDRTFFLY